jgi:ElaB/YqjD/DUF883 family membrane-anchored ribosome-binding protein
MLTGASEMIATLEEIEMELAVSEREISGLSEEQVREQLAQRLLDSRQRLIATKNQVVEQLNTVISMVQNLKGQEP